MNIRLSVPLSSDSDNSYPGEAMFYLWAEDNIVELEIGSRTVKFEYSDLKKLCKLIEMDESQ